MLYNLDSTFCKRIEFIFETYVIDLSQGLEKLHFVSAVVDTIMAEGGEYQMNDVLLFTNSDEQNCDDVNRAKLFIIGQFLTMITQQ